MLHFQVIFVQFNLYCVNVNKPIYIAKMKLKSWHCLIFLILNITFILKVGEAGKILFYTPFAAKSYKITFTPLLEELSK